MPTQPIEACLSPLDLAAHEIEVELRLPADLMAKGPVLALPAWTPGSYLVRDYAKFLDRVRLTDAEGKTLELRKLDKQRWQLPAMKGEATLRYRLFCNELTVRTNHVDASHAQLQGAATFLYPEGEGRPVEVRFESWPKDWRVATGLPKRRGCYFAQNQDALVDAPFELGTFKLHTWKVGKTAFELAITGKHAGDEERIREATERVTEVCGEIFDGFPFQRYVFLLTFSPGQRGGLEHRESTALLADPHHLDSPEGYYELFTLIAHEFFHVWNVKRLRASELGPFDYSRENPTRLLWFHEGFTSLLQYTLVTRAGLVPWSWVERKLSALWTEYTTRAGRLEQSLEESSFDAWIRLYKPNEWSPNSSVSYYEKGALVAWMMEARIRLASKGKLGLEDLFRLLWKQIGDGHLRDEDLRKAYGTLTGQDPAPFWDAWISGLEELDPREIQQAFGLRFESRAPWEQLRRVDDPDGLARAKVYTGLAFGSGATIQNVFPDSPAAQAGLSYGMEILAVNGWRTASGHDAQNRFGDLPLGSRFEVLAGHLGRVSTFSLTTQEHPHRSTLIQADSGATPAQRSAFKAWTGLAFPARRIQR
ncbi:M61 family metallopeptidase [Holophaga foetida]|uniref:M61 family metallopeptidase n=1 Tax=Holophaga foetida TaxID=35839 RepID=UPI0002471CD7|nr:PDZ domain-containing protein [Holophaga foetida]